MQRALLTLGRMGRDRLARTLECLPISSRTLGPPKGCYASFDEYRQTARDVSAEEWPVLAPESLLLRPPSLVPEEYLPIFRPLRHESPGFGLYCIQKGRFHRDARTILTKDDRVLSSFSACMGRGPRDNWLFKKIRLEPLHHVSGKSLLLVGQWNYYHFLIEELPRIWLATEAGFKIDDFDHIIMFTPIHRSQQLACERLGISREKIIPLETLQHIESDEFYFTTGPWHYGRTFALTARDFLLGIFHGSNSFCRGSRIYISRERRGHGRISNEEELVHELALMGFEKVVPEDLSFDEQVGAFQNAEWIIGAHGAGLTNVIFAPAGCRLVEIRNPTYNANETYQARGGNIFWRLSEFLGLDYHAFFALPDDTEYWAPGGGVVEKIRLPNLTVDVASFMSFLSMLHGLPAGSKDPTTNSF